MQKANFVLLGFIFSFCTGNLYAQLTYVTCNSACPGTLVGHVTFGNTSGTTTGRWDVNNLAYGGLTNESFTITDPTSFTYAPTGNLTTTGGGTYCIVSNPATVDGPTGLPLADASPTTPNGGIFLIRPNNTSSPFALYTISGLQVGGKYCVRVKMRNATSLLNDPNGCNQSIFAQLRFGSLSGIGLSGQGPSGGMWTRVADTSACTQGGNSGTWDGNNQVQGIVYDQEESWYECNFTLGLDATYANDNGFTLSFQPTSVNSTAVWGIEEIEVYGCITQQILSSNGTSVCSATPTTLTAQGIGSTTDSYTWLQSTDGGAIYNLILSHSSDTLSVIPSTTTIYSVTCSRTGVTLTDTITPVNCCGPTGLFTIPEVCDAITVDGIDNEPVWNTAPWEYVTKPYALDPTNSAECINSNPTCAGVQENPAAQWRCVRNATDLYFDVRVNESNPQNARQVYFQDAVEIYVANASNQPLQFGYPFSSTGTPTPYGNQVTGSAKIVQNPNYWDLEISIPIAANNINLTPGYINMELAVNQAKDGGCTNCRAAQLFTWIASNAYSSTADYHSAPLSSCDGITATDSTVCGGASTTLTTQLSTENAGLPYSWQQSTDGGVTWVPVPSGGATNTITVSPTVTTEYTATYDAVVSCPITINIGALSISGTATACVGSTTTLTGSVAGGTWSTSDPTIATVSSTGVVTGVAAGKAAINYTKGCVATDSVTINAVPVISGTTNVCAGNSVQLSATTTPAATNPWVSLTTLVATVDDNGKVTGASNGTSQIVYTNSSDCTDTVTVTVSSAPSISGTTTVCNGKTTSLTGSGTPASSNAWVSLTTSVAIVDNNGLVTGASSGTSQIVYTNSNGCTDTVTVTVNPAASITGGSSVCNGKTLSLTGSGTPAGSNAWGSLTTSVATVDNNGVVTGASSGTSQIVYTNSSGCTDTSSITVNPLPFITGSITVSAGSTIQLAGIGTPATPTAWSSATPSIATVDNNGNVSGIAAGTSVITYTNSNGCSNDTTVTVTNLPTITGSTNVCVGGTDPLTGSGTPASSNPWSSASTAVATVDNNGVVTGVSAGTSIITYTNSSGKSADTTITVNITMTADFTITQPTLCTGNAINFINASSVSAVSWAWNFGDGGTSSSPNPSHTYSIAGPYSISLQVKDNNGCIGNLSDTLITVNPVPQAAFTIPVICLSNGSTTVSFTATNLGPATVAGWQWDFDNGSIQSGQTVSYPYTTGGAHTIQLIDSTNEGCKDTLTQNDTAYNIPVAKDSIENDSSLCSNAPVMLINESSVGYGNITSIGIYWDYLNNPNAVTTYPSPASGAVYQNSYPALTANQSYEVLMQVYNGNGCPVTADTSIITVHGIPTVQFTPLTSVCENVPPFVLNEGSQTSNLPGGVGTYSGPGVTDSLFSPQVAGIGTSTIVYTFTANGCSADTSQNISVYPVPVVNYDGTQSVLEGDSITLVAVNDTATGLQYMWSPAIYLSSDTSAAPLCKPLDSVTYTIMVTSPGGAGCSASTTLFVQVLTDFIVPNTFTPNHDGVNDTWDIPELPKYPIQWVQVFDRYGQLLYESHGYSTPGWDGTYKGHPLPSGTYYYIIELNGIISPKTGYVTILR